MTEEYYANIYDVFLIRVLGDDYYNSKVEYFQCTSSEICLKRLVVNIRKALKEVVKNAAVTDNVYVMDNASLIMKGLGNVNDLDALNNVLEEVYELLKNLWQ